MSEEWFLSVPKGFPINIYLQTLFNAEQKVNFDDPEVTNLQTVKKVWIGIYTKRRKIRKV